MKLLLLITIAITLAACNVPEQGLPNPSLIKYHPMYVEDRQYDCFTIFYSGYGVALSCQRIDNTQ